MGLPVSNQGDPLMALMMASVEGVDDTTQLQSATSEVVEQFTTAATHSVTAGNDILEKDAKAMQGLSGDKLTQAYSTFQKDQTVVSTTNSKSDALGKAGATNVSDVSQALSTIMQFPQAVIDAQSNVTQLLMGMA